MDRVFFKTCPVCGKGMYRQSKLCRGCYIKQHLRPESYSFVKCQKCGKEFKTHKIHLKRGQAKYCSRHCARSGSLL